MTNKAILREIHRDNKSINRNLQRLANIGLIGLLGKSAEDAKKTNDSVFSQMKIISVAPNDTF